MSESNKRQPPDSSHRSFVMSDFSVREIPGALVIYVVLSVVCVALGLTMEALPSFWKGFVFGIAVALAAVAALALVLGKRDKRK